MENEKKVSLFPVEWLNVERWLPAGIWRQFQMQAEVHVQTHQEMPIVRNIKFQSLNTPKQTLFRETPHVVNEPERRGELWNFSFEARTVGVLTDYSREDVIKNFLGEVGTVGSAEPIRWDSGKLSKEYRAMHVVSRLPIPL